MEGTETACVRTSNAMIDWYRGWECGSLGGNMVKRGSLLFHKIMNTYREMLVLQHQVVGEEGGEGEPAGKTSTLEPKYG